MFWWFFVMAVSLVVSIWGVASPRSLYWTLHAWQHRDPHANEPSDAAYALTRVSSVIVMVVLVVAGVALWGAHNDQQRAATCRDELLPRFVSEWRAGDGRHDRLEALADELGLELVVEPRSNGTSYQFHDAAGEVMSAYEPSSSAGWSSMLDPRCAR